MHELAMAEGILQLIEDSARAQGFRSVRTVWLEVGQLSSVEAEAMRFCFGAVTRDSIAAGASLEIVDIPGQGWCPRCLRTVSLRALYDPCPHCGSYQVQASGGTEMRVKELEVD
ncbi:MAG: hydrogenase maturation nickel metallochaperone HypA [Rhodocyclaceae bacterium]|nr:MAG: hydrogenase maturation nickel metallochaperone HypA [Rhodocyclaceae bacterium]